jgi:hypothetical protein
VWACVSVCEHVCVCASLTGPLLFSHTQTLGYRAVGNEGMRERGNEGGKQTSRYLSQGGLRMGVRVTIR